MPYCYSPCTNIDISPQGNISPCCKFQTQHYSERFDIQKHSIQDYVQSDFLKQVQKEFKNNQWPQGCERCRIEEEHNILSKRQLDQERWQELYNEYDSSNGFVTASVAFGNTCNLTCITCNPRSSSRWQLEHKQITGVDIRPFHFYKQNFVWDFVQSAPNLVHVDIPGGEPFLSGVDEQQNLLTHYINTTQSQNITLHYTTNATLFPDHTWWDLWQHFKEVDIQISVDGLDKKYEYIRYPAKWNTFESVVQQYLTHSQSNLRLSVSHTVSAYNVYYLDEFFEWAQNTGLPTPWLGRVHTPAHMRPSVWTPLARETIVQKLHNSKHTDVRVWAEMIRTTNDSDQFELFRSRLHQHDEFRKLNFATVFTEMAKFI
jgi:MoaA/NifB/PqqE/SkfB family radical SAM enzyme